MTPSQLLIMGLLASLYLLIFMVWLQIQSKSNISMVVKENLYLT